MYFAQRLAQQPRRAFRIDVEAIGQHAIGGNRLRACPQRALIGRELDQRQGVVLDDEGDVPLAQCRGEEVADRGAALEEPGPKFTLDAQEVVVVHDLCSGAMRRPDERGTVTSQL